MHQFTRKKPPNDFNTYFSYTTIVSSRLTRQTSSNKIFYPALEICDVNAHQNTLDQKNEMIFHYKLKILLILKI